MADFIVLDVFAFCVVVAGLAVLVSLFVNRPKIEKTSKRKGVKKKK